MIAFAGKRKKGCTSLIKCKVALISLVLFVFFVTWMVCTVLFTAVLPNTQLALTTGTRVRGNSTLTLASNPEFLEVITMQFLDNKDCAEPSDAFGDEVPTVLLFKDVECSKLPVKTVLRPENIYQQSYVYALPGSHIYFPVPNNDSKAVNESWPHIWVTDSYESNRDLYTKIHSEKGCQHFYKCQDFPDMCFATEDYVGRSIVYNISREGYYNYFLSDRDDCSTMGTFDSTAIKWNYNMTQYDIDTIRQKESFTPVRLDKLMNLLRLSGLFELGRKPCALLDLPGAALKFSCVKIGVKAPWDVAVLVSVVCVLLLICVLMGSYFCWRFNRQRESTIV